MRSRANKYRVLPQPGITNYNSPIIASLSSALIYRMAAWALNFPHSPVLVASDYYIPGSSHSGNIRHSNQQLHQIHANNRTRSPIVEFSIFGNPNTLDATHNKRRFYPHNNRVCWWVSARGKGLNSKTAFDANHRTRDRTTTNRR